MRAQNRSDLSVYHSNCGPLYMATYRGAPHGQLLYISLILSCPSYMFLVQYFVKLQCSEHMCPSGTLNHFIPILISFLLLDIRFSCASESAFSLLPPP